MNLKKFVLIFCIFCFSQVLIGCTVEKPKPFTLPKSSLFKNENTYDVFYIFNDIEEYQKSVSVPQYMADVIKKSWELEDIRLLQGANSKTLKLQDDYNQDLLNKIREVSWINTVSFDEIDNESEFIKKGLNRYDGAKYQILLQTGPIVYRNNLYNLVDFRIYSREEYMKNRVFDLKKIAPLMRLGYAVNYSFGRTKLEGWDSKSGTSLEDAIRKTTQKGLEQFDKYLNDPYTIHDYETVLDIN